MLRTHAKIKGGWCHRANVEMIEQRLTTDWGTVMQAASLDDGWGIDLMFNVRSIPSGSLCRWRPNPTPQMARFWSTRSPHRRPPTSHVRDPRRGWTPSHGEVTPWTLAQSDLLDASRFTTAVTDPFREFLETLPEWDGTEKIRTPALTASASLDDDPRNLRMVVPLPCWVILTVVAIVARCLRTPASPSIEVPVIHL